MAEKPNDVRLYSKAPRVPVDVIAPQHTEIHAELERWGAWNRERYEAGTCSSMEKGFDNTGGRSVKKAVVSLPPDPILRILDKTLRMMVMRVPQHAEAIKLYYATRRTPVVICRVLVIHWKDFGTWMFDARAMVINISRELT